MKSAGPYPVIPAGIAGIQAPGMAKAVLGFAALNPHDSVHE